MDLSDHRVSIDRPPTAEQEKLLEAVIEMVKARAVIPIVSNSFRNDRIFAGLDSKRIEAAAEKLGPTDRSLTTGERLKSQAALWVKEGRKGGLLLRGQALADAMQWGQAHKDELTRAAIDFLSTSCVARRREAAPKLAETSRKPAEAAAEGYGPADRSLTVDERLAKRWADQIHYPMWDCRELARVAQFCRFETGGLFTAKNDYLKFIKDELLKLAEANGEPADLVEELQRRKSERSFADLAQELDYPRFPEGREDPLRLLARLSLPIYVTTSYYDFLERALTAEGYSPRTQICWWGQRQSSAIPPKHRPDPDFEPSRREPLVYHLHGLEQYPRSLVLSEDDYLDFLVAVAEDIKAPDQHKPVILPYLSQELTQSSLILLGYRLEDWDFRVVFRGIIKLLRPYHRPNLVILLDPEAQSGISDCRKAREYLKKFLAEAAPTTKFDVMWCDAESFIQMLWDKYRQGQT